MKPSPILPVRESVDLYNNSSGMTATTSRLVNPA
jgi:hypothetical protein